MSPHTTHAARPDPGVPAWLARRMSADWPAVHIDLVEVVPGPSGGRVRAVVRLGGLTPADVEVEVRASAPTGRSADGRAMWSSQPYDNGSFVFEATFAGDELAAHDEWLVRVRPRAPLPAPDVQHRLRVGAPPVGPH